MLSRKIVHPRKQGRPWTWLLLCLAVLIVTAGAVFPGWLSRRAIHADGPTVVINELLWTGSAISSADEWIELRNVSDHAVDLSGWTMTKKSSGAETSMMTIPSGKIIPAASVFLISNYANTSPSTTLNVVPDYVTTDVALANSTLQIKLYDASHALVDAADDGVGNPLAGELDSAKKIYASMERNPVPGDGTLAQNWHTASRTVGLKPGAIELGTPESVNSNGKPTAIAGPDQNGVVGQSLNFDGSDSSDPESQPLVFTWSFGDGSSAAEITPAHTFTAAGVYTVTLTVNDGTDMSSDVLQATIQAAPAAEPAGPVPEAPTGSTGEPPAGTCQGLRLSELYPNPVGVDSGEFIELVNDGEEDMVLSGCAVGTTAAKTFKLPVGTTVPLHGFLLLPKSQTHLTLTNSGSTVRLADADGTELDRVTYETAKEGQTWSHFGDAWAWTIQPTPGAANVLVAADISSGKKSTTGSTKTTKKKSAGSAKAEVPAERVTLAQVQELDSGDRVIISGIVTVPRDALGSTLVYIQTPDGGLSVSIPNGEPTMKLGQGIEVTGTVRLKNGRRYVSAAAHGVVTQATVGAPIPVMTATDDVGPDQADQLVQVKGLVSLASGNRIEIDDGSGPVSLYLKSSTGIVRPKVKAGDTVEAVGIVGVSTSGVRVLPRAQEDLHVERVLGASTAVPTQTITPPAASKSQTLWYWSLVGLGALVAGARPVWKWLKKKRVESNK